MAIDKVVPLTSGGTLILSLERVNVFTLTDSERQLVAEIAEALKKYERRSVTAEKENNGS